MTLAVYPRWRGEHSCSCRDTSWAPGLSPLARGTQVADWRGYRANRFIPAGAGNTHHLIAPYQLETVYPRWRGEHTKRISLFINYFLSAPHSTNIIATI
ncbi:hypothetical protein predicted by Glimmer/Critica [Salmonella enterica subsp. enterica serovar Weltevreden str. 2007-60-3289-1]|nr:hypothetical protein predicted by Glimmer/Critica [Salmonella enterica subsp. enterica serovar Weltevreden str. 2007-60-3289-1]